MENTLKLTINDIFKTFLDKEQFKSLNRIEFNKKIIGYASCVISNISYLNDLNTQDKRKSVSKLNTQITSLIKQYNEEMSNKIITKDYETLRKYKDIDYLLQSTLLCDMLETFNEIEKITKYLRLMMSALDDAIGDCDEDMKYRIDCVWDAIDELEVKCEKL